MYIIVIGVICLVVYRLLNACGTPTEASLKTWTSHPSTIGVNILSDTFCIVFKIGTLWVMRVLFFYFSRLLTHKMHYVVLHLPSDTNTRGQVYKTADRTL